jgi:hypothetical protein
MQYCLHHYQTPAQQRMQVVFHPYKKEERTCDRPAVQSRRRIYDAFLAMLTQKRKSNIANVKKQKTRD